LKSFAVLAFSGKSPIQFPIHSDSPAPWFKRQALPPLTTHHAAEIETLKSLIASGLSLAQVGTRMGMTRSVVGGIVRRLQIKGVVLPRSNVRARSRAQRSTQTTGEHSQVAKRPG
jgi:GcrA cell cycle regulator